MKQLLERILCRYGRELELRTAQGSFPVRAFLQPVTGRGENMARFAVTPLGRENEARYVFIGPVSPEAREEDVLVCPEGSFLLRRCEVLEGPGGCAYRWGMCVRMGEEDTWGHNG